MKQIKIGIDPDVHKSGVALVSDNELLDYKASGFYDVLQTIRNNNTNPNCELTVVIEAGWLNKKSNWHGSPNQATAQRIAKNVGANHQIGKLFEEFCQLEGIQYRLSIPKKAKLDKAKVSQLIGTKISNQDIIDAIALVYDPVTALKYYP